MVAVKLPPKNEKTPKERSYDIIWTNLRVIDLKGYIYSSKIIHQIDEIFIIYVDFRYNELIRIHGKLDPLVNIDLRPERKVRVTIVYGNELQERNIDVYQTVTELKQKLENFANISASKMKLFYLNQHMKHVIGPEHMKFPNKQLYSYNIRNGDEIIVDSKNKK